MKPQLKLISATSSGGFLAVGLVVCSHLSFIRDGFPYKILNTAPFART